MSSILERLDFDESTVLLSLNALKEGSSTGFEVIGDLSIGEIETEAEWIIQRPFAGADQAEAYHPIVEISGTLRLRGTSVDGMLRDLRTLVRYLDLPGPWLFQPKNATLPLILDGHRSPLPSPLRGGELALYRLVTALNVEIPLRLWCQPYGRSAPTTVFTGNVTNEAGSRSFAVTNNGPVPGLLTIQAAPANNPASRNLVQMEVARMSRGAITERAASFTSMEVENGTLENGTTSVADTEASGGDKAQTNFAVAGAMLRRSTLTLTPADITALVGADRLDLVLQPRSPFDWICRVMLKWGWSSSGPRFSTPQYSLDTTVLQQEGWFKFPLGFVHVPDGAESLILELWASSDVATRLLDWDTANLVPSDELMVTVTEPNIYPPATGAAHFPSADPVGTAAFATPDGCTGNAGLIDDGTAMYINGNKQGLTNKALGGEIYPLGRVNVLVDGRVRNNEHLAVHIADLRVRKGAATVAAWQASHAYTVGTIVRPTNANRNGRTFVVAAIAGTGTSHATTEPTWPATDGGTVIDNPGLNQVSWLETTVASQAIESLAGVNTWDRQWAVAWDADGTTSYEVVVVQIVTGTADGYAFQRSFRPNWWDITPIPTISNPNALLLDSSAESAYAIDATGTILGRLQGVPLVEAAPGTQLFVVNFGQVPAVGMESVDARSALVRQNPGAACAIVATLVERYPL